MINKFFKFWNYKNKAKLKYVFGIMILISFLFFWGVTFFLKQDETLHNIKIVYADSMFMYSRKQIENLVDGMVKIGDLLSSINLQKIENALVIEPWVKTTQAFLINHTLFIKIKFKQPKLKILSNNNELMYLDEESNLVNKITEAYAHVPLVVNYNVMIKDSVQKILNQQLANLSDMLCDFNQDFNNWYIDLKKIDNIVIRFHYPEMKFILGDFENLKNKIIKMFYFYEYAQKNMLKFSEVNVQYRNQIIGIN